MFIYLLISVLFLPLFNAEHPQMKLDNNDDLLIHRSGAANYLFGLPMRRYQNHLANPMMDRSLSLMSSDNDDQQQQQQQRGKRIYWENLAFQPADYNKAKNPKRSK
ncbi:hypothetical protein I4U23_001624 [Adineta vaga]|nr:hypothetical protein I4U23_001624 [Adineta vaga]